MADKSSGSGWRTQQVYAMAVICLGLGLALGYLFRGSATKSVASQAAPTQAAPQDSGTQQMPTLEQMKQMADKQAEPLLAQLKSDPNNAALLIQIGRIYESTHQFKDAAGYFGKSLGIDPKNKAIRTEMASCLYYGGDVDGAIAQLEQLLKDDPKDANSLFNLGIMRWKGKDDAKGAVTAWQQLLQSNPNLEADKKAQVKKLIAEAQQHGSGNP